MIDGFYLTGAIVGIIGAILPRLLEQWREHADFKREKWFMKFQRENPPPVGMPPSHDDLKADLDYVNKLQLQDNRFVDHSGLRGTGLGILASFLITTVRPVLTYMIIIAWIVWESTNDKSLLPYEIDIITFVVSFYFGGRQMMRQRGK